MPTPHSQMRLTPDDLAVIAEIAEAEACSRTEAVRRAVRTHRDYLAFRRSQVDERSFEAARLYNRLEAALGEEFATGWGEVGFEFTPQGRVALKVGPTTFFDVGGELVAGRERDGTVEFASIPAGQSALDELQWERVPAGVLGTPELN